MITNRKLDFYLIKIVGIIAKVQGLLAFSVSFHPVLKVERSRPLLIYSLLVTVVHLIILPIFFTQIYLWIYHSVELKLVLNHSSIFKHFISVLRIIVMYLSQRYYSQDIYNAIQMLIGIYKNFNRMNMPMDLSYGTSRVWYYRRIVGAVIQVLSIILLFVVGYHRYTKDVAYLDIISFAFGLSFHVTPLTISMMYFGAMFMAYIFYKQLGEKTVELMGALRNMKKVKKIENKFLSKLSVEIETISLAYKDIGVYVSNVNKVFMTQLLLVFGNGFSVMLLEV